MKNVQKIYKTFLVVWTVVILSTLLVLINEKINETHNIAKSTIDASLKQDTMFRYWASSHGGVYVKATKETPPNPHLSHLKNRDIITKDQNLTLMNPAYILRQMMQRYEGIYGLKGHITSLKALNSKYNTPDEWETKVLKKLDVTKDNTIYYEYVNKDGKKYLRAFEPLLTKESCLKCHSFQGYKEGDIRGGVSITLPMEELHDKRGHSIIMIVFWFLLAYIVGLFLITYFYKRLLITQKKEKELYHALVESEKYFKTVVNTSKNIIIVNHNREIQKVNNAFLEYTGFDSLEKFKEKYDCICDLFIEKDGYLSKIVNGEYWADYIYKNQNKTHKALIEKEGKIYTFTVTSDMMLIEDKQMFTIAFNDITMLAEKEEIMLAQSRHAAMGEMISMIAHQWRQPITVISMNANNILADIELFGKVENDELKENSYSIIKQTQHLSRTIEDFKNFFKPHVEKDKVIINDVIEECFEIIGSSLVNNNISVTKNYDSKSEVEIYSREFLQVIINILKNGKEALVSNKIKDPKLTIDTYEDKGKVYIKVCDNGTGVDDSIINKIFDPYFTTKDDKNGTGLGLYMSKTIIEKHLKGQIKCHNDNGACFLISLNLKD